MAKEIERKFLVLRDDWQPTAGRGSVLQQAYLCADDDRNLRVRIFDNSHAKITIKVGHTALSRDEFEYDIPLADALQMLELRLGEVIEKTRYRIAHGGYTFEVDVFAGALAGLVVAEVEMQSETDQPDLPGWLGPEVTGDPLYTNQSLALLGRPTGMPNG